jgi:microcystin degradation protein MlrC
MVAEAESILDIPKSVKNTALQGIIEVCQEEDIEIIPSFFAQTLPSGAIRQEAYESMRERLLDNIRGAGKLDAVVLSMHGSMYVEGVGDADGDLLASIRALVSSQVPIVCALDLHGTITDQMVENGNAFVGYRTAPHIDKVETGRRAMRLAIKAVQERLQLRTSWVSVPMIISGEQSETSKPPTSEIIQELVHIPEKGEILSSSVFLGFPWADVPYSCVSALAVTIEENRDLGQEEAQRLATMFWSNRTRFQFTTEAYLLEKCLDIAESEPSGPVIIADCGDNPTAGSSEDLTYVVDVLMQRKFKNALVAVIFDPDSYERCVKSGENQSVDLELGRVNPNEQQPRPLVVKAIVETIGSGKGIPSAVIRIDAIRAIISTKRIDVYDPEFLTDLGLNPLDYQAIIVKSGYLSPEYQALTNRPLLALTPGDTNPLLETVPYKLVKRPIYPVDKDFDWPLQP